LGWFAGDSRIEHQTAASDELRQPSRSAPRYRVQAKGEARAPAPPHDNASVEAQRH
jgi:hypothetical protein